MSGFSGAASSEHYSNTDQPQHSESDVAAGAGRPVIPSRHPEPGRTQQPSVCAERHRHQAGHSWHPPMFHLSDISVFAQQVPDTERAQKLHIHHQQ